MPGSWLLTISALILAKNEEKNLPRLLRSLAWVDEIVVVDDGSTDRTADIAREFRARVIAHPLEDFSAQCNFGLAQASGDWILRLDADEEIPAATGSALQAAVREAPAEVGGFRLLRRNYVLGRWVRHAQEYGMRVRWYDWRRRRQGLRPGDYLGGAVKLFRRRDSRYVNLVHEEVALTGKVMQLQADVNHYTGESIQDIFDKVNVYTTLHARQLFRENPVAEPRGLWRKIAWEPANTFFYLYVRKCGFLDGFPGWVRCTASAWYEFLKYLKLHDLYRQASQQRRTGTGKE
jgi:glycosyltransferase involved in cell wall biosynthesis